MNSTPSVWDDPAAQIGGDFVQWENPGDTITGTVVEVRFGEDFHGNKCPELVIDAGDAGEKIVTAGQVRLKAELLEVRPSKGDVVAITFTHVEPRPGGKTMKHFSVIKGGATAPAAPAAPATPPPAAGAIDPAAAAAALAALTPEQRAALNLPPA